MPSCVFAIQVADFVFFHILLWITVSQSTRRIWVTSLPPRLTFAVLGGARQQEAKHRVFSWLSSSKNIALYSRSKGSRASWHIIISFSTLPQAVPMARIWSASATLGNTGDGALPTAGLTGESQACPSQRINLHSLFEFEGQPLNWTNTWNKVGFHSLSPGSDWSRITICNW